MTNVRYAARREEPSSDVSSAPVRATAKALWADYETDPEIIASVLPRPIVPGLEPIVHLAIGQVEMESGAGFGIGNITVRAAHGDLQGEYGLAMPMGSEAAVIGGRETWGEPKKIADCRIDRNGDDVVATITRGGISYAELRGRVVETLPVPPPRETLDFYFRISRWERVEGEVILRESPLDPIVDIPVRRLVQLHYVEFESEQVGEIVDRVPGEWIAPFAHQRYDHFSWQR